MIAQSISGEILTMITFVKKKNGLIAFALATAVIAGSGCGKSVEIGAREGGNVLRPSDQNRATPLCNENERIHWTFIQPDVEKGGAVDLLFVVDTS